MKQPQIIPALLGLAMATAISSCAVSPETQAKMDEFNRTIPSCSSSADCGAKWDAARSWTEENSSFVIQGDSDTRIFASSTLTTQSGLGVVVYREESTTGFNIVVDIECFSAYGCSNLWDKKVEFNRTINGIR
ncbi:MAG: hypothetical protein HOF74_01805 [Gammaproteobacteria bacterium]|jgi:hypothetical protein|nr:hypothetical protein [Gammaproteobacteria bacterium]MBT3858543.1 hypothetical protein [Gammaproteobacteria bacterium]MBT3986719.1 hypothetical protein [Gammaproteobacteria bacterium]MBT4255631.1 hypothetical protein [Gammaproteobacteria bacterium]MBT4582815.1 hypothetical protein [Gammaproteobacteria bacterium]